MRLRGIEDCGTVLRIPAGRFLGIAKQSSENRPAGTQEPSLCVHAISIELLDRIRSAALLEPLELVGAADQHDLAELPGADVLEPGDLLAGADGAADGGLFIFVVVGDGF